MTDRPVVKEIYIAAPPEVVFEFLTDPVKMVNWMGANAELEPKSGGIFHVSLNSTESMQGTYLEIIPNRKVVFTWGWNGSRYSFPAGSSIVEIVLEPRDSGTWLRLTHRDLPDEARDDHEAGWIHYLSRLKTVAEGGTPGGDPFEDPNWRDTALQS